MSSALGSLRGISQAFILIVAALVFAPGTARAQFPGYGAMASRGTATPVPFGYGMPGYGYGILNPFFGLGLTPLGIHSHFTESNLLGRGQLEASRRARARELQGYRER